MNVQNGDLVFYVAPGVLYCTVFVTCIVNHMISPGIATVCSACLYKGWESLDTSQFGLISIQGVIM